MWLWQFLVLLFPIATKYCYKISGFKLHIYFLKFLDPQSQKWVLQGLIEDDSRAASRSEDQGENLSLWRSRCWRMTAFCGWGPFFKASAVALPSLSRTSAPLS